MLSTAEQVEVPSTLLEFCKRRQLSIRSRLELLEQLAELVATAHQLGIGFADLNVETVMLEFIGGELSIHLTHQIEIKDERVTVAGRYSTGDLVRAANLVQLGRLVAAICPEDSRDGVLSVIVGRATSLGAERFRTAQQIADAIRHVRWELKGGYAQSDPRWSWA